MEVGFIKMDLIVWMLLLAGWHDKTKRHISKCSWNTHK